MLPTRHRRSRSSSNMPRPPRTPAISLAQFENGQYLHSLGDMSGVAGAQLGIPIVPVFPTAMMLPHQSPSEGASLATQPSLRAHAPMPPTNTNSPEGLTTLATAALATGTHGTQANLRKRALVDSAATASAHTEAMEVEPGPAAADAAATAADPFTETPAAIDTSAASSGRAGTESMEVFQATLSADASVASSPAPRETTEVVPDPAATAATAKALVTAATAAAAHAPTLALRPLPLYRSNMDAPCFMRHERAVVYVDFAELRALDTERTALNEALKLKAPKPKQMIEDGVKGHSGRVFYNMQLKPGSGEVQAFKRLFSAARTQLPFKSLLNETFGEGHNAHLYPVCQTIAPYFTGTMCAATLPSPSPPTRATRRAMHLTLVTCSLCCARTATDVTSRCHTWTANVHRISSWPSPFTIRHWTPSRSPTPRPHLREKRPSVSHIYECVPRLRR